MNGSVVRVVVDIPTRQVSSTFDYSVDGDLAARVDVGCAVLVDFAGRPAVGWVVETPVTPAVDQLKPVRDVLSGPMFDACAARVGLWIAREYVATPADAIRLLLPPGSTHKARRTEVEGVVRWELIGPRVGAVDERWVELAADSLFAPRANARLQRSVLGALSQGPVSMAELSAEFGSVNQSVRALESAGAVRVTQRRRYRRAAGEARESAAPAELSGGQSAALEAIAAASPGACVLLDGVTGSGKTEVYIQAIERVMDAGGSAIVLVPEISLTPQTVGRFRTRFGGLVAVLHSRLGVGERLDEWERIRRGEARLVIGARSALFAPAQDLALIVIDEEHESSYKQGSSPRYHTRDVALRIAREREAVLVLGSATPSLEALTLADRTLATMVRLPERVAGGSLPGVTIVDMGKEFAEGHRSMFSRILARQLLRVEAERGKAVLLLNRRGFASFLLCRECGYVPECESCSTSLTYHETNRRLACHHCGAAHDVPVQCPRCQSVYLRQFGAGTQRVEAELAALLPSLPVVRMDADTTTGKGGHERVLSEFEDLESGVLLGTQMVAKGLDYPDVTLVGVLNADTTLHLPDFRAAERTYQLLSQVAGRAGRGPKGGAVVIQTYWPDHAALRATATHDREALIAEETSVRRSLGYPPFGRLANVIASAEDHDAARTVCERLADHLRSAAPSSVVILGPSPAPLARLKRAYRWHLLLKAPEGFEFGPLLHEAATAVRTQGASVAIDVDPYDLL